MVAWFLEMTVSVNKIAFGETDHLVCFFYFWELDVNFPTNRSCLS